MRIYELLVENFESKIKPIIHQGEEEVEESEINKAIAYIQKKCGQGDDNSLKEAINSGHEIMFTSPHVILIDYNFYEGWIAGEL